MEQEINFLLGFIALLCTVTAGAMLCWISFLAIDRFVEWRASQKRAYLRRLPVRLARLNG